MCLRDNTYVGVVSRSRDGTSHSFDASTRTWTVEMDYITSTANKNKISGFGACSDTEGIVNNANPTLTFDISGEGTHCWCQMQSPVVSGWVYYGAFASEGACNTGCLNACGNSVQTSADFRTAMAETVW